MNEHLTPWIKSTRSSNTGTCVEMRRHGSAVEVRDSKNPSGAIQQYSQGHFAAWLDGAKQGEFDHLA